MLAEYTTALAITTSDSTGLPKASAALLIGVAGNIKVDTFAREPVMTFTIVSGVITAITLVQPGFGFSSAPTLAIIDPTGTGSGATATCTVVNGVVTTVTLTAGGSGYISAIMAYSGGTAVTLAVPAGLIPLAVSKIYATGTTATGITAFYVK